MRAMVLLMPLMCLAGVSGVVEVNFERHLQSGKSEVQYTDDMVKADWGSVPYTTADRYKLAAVVRDGGSAVLRVKYPKGCYGTKCALQIKASGDYAGEEVWGSFRLMFEDGFDFRRGGKLPGFCGGSCVTGCKERTGFNGWSARSMWRDDGRAIGYMYIPSDDPPRCGANWDWSQKFTTGRWHTVRYHVKLNTVSGGRPNTNGVMQTWLDGSLVLDRQDVVFRYDDKQLADTFYFSTFHGGGDSSWAPTQDSYALFDDFVLSGSPPVTPPATAPPSTPTPPSPVAVVSGRTYKVVSRESGEVLAIAGWSTQNGARVQQASWVGGADQRWVVSDIGGGRYRLKSVHSGKCADVRQVSTNDGAHIHQWGCGTQGNKLFFLKNVGGGYYEMRATHSGKCVGISAGGAEQRTCTGAEAQHFRFDLVSTSTPSPPATPPPTPRPVAPTPPPTPSGCSSIREWGSCRNSPGCCASGLNCYEKSQWYAQCRKSCEGKSSWTCRVLG
eukprot:TRINITY_DN1295_c1_g2_i1.p1 TRINITY_DN1295_c1_g2~~TRINITY_DN1295_c1_g2_i1.p1  ORF type:complete len:499 (+),score=118.46 TRINITY_DN1295_c1_g2_i1:260-1756(+)